MSLVTFLSVLSHLLTVFLISCVCFQVLLAGLVFWELLSPDIGWDTQCSCFEGSLRISIDEEKEDRHVRSKRSVTDCTLLMAGRLATRGCSCHDHARCYTHSLAISTRDSIQEPTVHAGPEASKQLREGCMMHWNTAAMGPCLTFSDPFSFSSCLFTNHKFLQEGCWTPNVISRETGVSRPWAWGGPFFVSFLLESRPKQVLLRCCSERVDDLVRHVGLILIRHNNLKVAKGSVWGEAGGQ